MDAEQTLSVQQALDVIEHMPLEDQMTVIEVLQRRLLAQRRSELRGTRRLHCKQSAKGTPGMAAWRTSSGTWIHEKTGVTSCWLTGSSP